MSPNPKEHLPLQPHVFQVLISLIESSRHGYSIIKDIGRRTGGEMALGTSTLYAAIKRMVKEGLLEETDRPADNEVGAERKYGDEQQTDDHHDSIPEHHGPAGGFSSAASAAKRRRRKSAGVVCSRRIHISANCSSFNCAISISPVCPFFPFSSN